MAWKIRFGDNEGEQNNIVQIHNKSKYKSDTEVPVQKGKHTPLQWWPGGRTNSNLHPGSLHHRQEMRLTEMTAGEVPV